MPARSVGSLLVRSVQERPSGLVRSVPRAPTATHIAPPNVTPARFGVPRGLPVGPIDAIALELGFGLALVLGLALALGLALVLGLALAMIGVGVGVGRALGFLLGTIAVGR